MAIYGVDVASYQGRPDWRRVYGAGIRFGFSKVTESTNYVNPTWSHNRAGMTALGDGFLPGAYHFLHGGNGAAQARYFLAKAGDVSKVAVALDVEASGADAATSRAWVAEFKRLTDGHPVIGYFPRWYWEAHGRPDLSFFDTIWQSHYVTGTGSAAALYRKAPASWWTQFGGEPISILQYSSSASVPGISGRCDVNAFRGSLDDLRALALGGDDMPSEKDIWQWDHIEAPIGPDGKYLNPKNENWRPDSYLRETYMWVRRVQREQAATQAAVAELAKTVGQLASDRGESVDVDALVQRITAAIESVTVRLDVADADDAS